jgi:hypothetical protein
MLLLTAIYHRNLGKYGFFGGSAIHTWSTFAPLFSHKPVIIVGSGMGAIARVALDNGSPHVFGLDLRSSIPMKSHRFRSYKPPLVMASEYEDRYVQIPESFTTSGDWFDERVSSALLDYDPGDSTIVIDIQLNASRFGLETLIPILRRKSAGTIMVRLYLDDNEESLLLSDLTVSSCKFRVFSFDTVAQVHQVVLVLTQWSRNLLYAVVPETDLVRRPIQIPTLTDPDENHRLTAISDAIFNVYMPGPGSTLPQVGDHLRESVTSTAGDYDSRFSYGQWTLQLRSLLVTEWACGSALDHLEMIRKWLSQGHASIEFGGATHRVMVDWHLCYHLVTYGARVCV